MTFQIVCHLCEDNRQSSTFVTVTNQPVTSTQFQPSMETATTTIQTCKSVDLGETYIIDLDASISETKLTIGDQSHIKNIISQSPEIISEALCSSLSQFTIKPTFPFPELIHWSAKNYAPSSRQIISVDGTKVIFNINSQAIRRAFNIPSIDSDQSPIQFSEENSLSVIKSLDSE